MARVFLLDPPTPEPVRSPLLSLCHLAASLRAAGHEVALLEASAVAAPKSAGALRRRVEAFRPDLLGLRLQTAHAQHGYAAARALRRCAKALVAGGPHPTAVPLEPLDQGFDYAIEGEAEQALVRLADALDGKRPLADVPGLRWRDEQGLHANARAAIADLDALAEPLDALELFDPAWYGPSRPTGPDGLLASRGCPSRCTFCANAVTGRLVRRRDPQAVARQVARLRREHGREAFVFFDDSFGAGRAHAKALCAALEEQAPGVLWSCTAHPAHLDPPVLAAMRRAGCRGVDLGLESGDEQLLRRIGKGATVEGVLRVVEAARPLGMSVVVNFMFGWPDETDAQLSHTVQAMERVAAAGARLGARGVVVPYPGTPLYEDRHEKFGFSAWWLREPPLVWEPFPDRWEPQAIRRAWRADAALERNFFGHPPGRVDAIRAALERKAEIAVAAIERAARG